MSDLKSKIAFGAEERIDEALSSGVIDKYDLLLLDGGKIGWIDKNGQKVMAESNKQIITVDELPTTGQQEDVIYVLNGKSYVYDGADFVSLSTDKDISALEEVIATKASVNDISALEEEIATKASTDEVDAKINKAALEDVSYEVYSKPEGTIVDYRDKEIRIMCPSDTQWSLQNVGAGGDSSSYYIGFKAYAPSSDVVSFKEDMAKTILDETMYLFEGNEFAGIDEFGRKYSIVWLPVASYNSETQTWTYFGVNSSSAKFIGWYYSVEWYDANGDIVASDCIKVNLSNESCHTSLEPFYVTNAIETAKSYTDEQIAKAAGVIEVVEF